MQYDITDLMLKSEVRPSYFDCVCIQRKVYLDSMYVQ